MKSFFLFPLLFFLSLTGFGQIYDEALFKVSQKELEMPFYEKDSTANAVVLFESGNSYFDKKGEIITSEIKKKVKIFSKNDASQTTVSILLYKDGSNKEEINSVEAITYNLEGNEITKAPLDPNKIFREAFDENHTIVKFTLPNVKDGSVITYAYAIKSPFVFKFNGWQFQEDIPKVYSQYQTRIPHSYDYNIKLKGFLKLSREDYSVEKKCLERRMELASSFNTVIVKDCNNAFYAMKNIPAFKEESYMTDRSNFMSSLDFELKYYGSKDYTKSWESVEETLEKNKYIGPQLKKSLRLNHFVPEAVSNDPNLTSKAKAIYSYVQKNYSWNGDYNIFNDGLIQELIKQKSGNVSSINLLLYNLLKEASIDVKPVLLSTRDHGEISKVSPVLTKFNYLIIQAKINDKTYFLDATDKYLAFGQLPFRCLNGSGRLLDFENGSQWISIEPDFKSSTLYQVTLDLDKSAEINGHIETKKTGYQAIQAKKKYYKNLNDYENDLKNSFPDLTVSNFNTKNTSKTSPDFYESYDVTYSLEKLNDTYFFNPFVIKLFNENPFKTKTRNYPVNFGYKSNFLISVRINIPDNFQMVEKPQDTALNLPDDTGTLVLSTKIVGHQINLLFRFDFKKSVYSANYYPYLRTYLSKISELQNNAFIVLRSI